MGSSVNGLIFFLSVLFSLLFLILAKVFSKVGIETGPGKLISGSHFPVKIVDSDLENFNVHIANFIVWAEGRQSIDIQYIVHFTGLNLTGHHITVIFFLLYFSPENNLIETASADLFISIFIEILIFFNLFAVFFLNALNFVLILVVILHEPEHNLLVVVSAEIDQVPDQIDYEVVLIYGICTLVGLRMFWSFSLKLKVSS